MSNAYLAMLATREKKLADASSLATYLIDTYLDPSWSFAWNNRVRALGICSYSKKQIGLSKAWALATPWDEVDDTLRHEVAHAIAGYAANHGPEWKEAAVLVGARPEATYTGPVKTRDVHVAKYEMVDTTTGKVVKSYYRKPTARTYRQVKGMYMLGRRVETEGKLVINPVDLIKELDL